MRRLAILVAAAAALAVLAAGCGGDDNGGEPLSQAEFVSAANGVCKEANDKSAELKPDLPQNFDPTSAKATDEQLDTFGDFLDDIVKIYRDEIDELRDVNAPANVEDDFNKALSLVEESLNEAEDAAAAAHDGDREELKAKLAESDEHSNEANEIAKKLGLVVCAG